MVARVVVACLGVLFATQSCTAVLGMERATLDLSADGSTGGGQGGSGNAPNTLVPKTNQCTEPPTTACTDCLRQNCASDYDGCVNDHDCRVKLREYALCLGDTCRVYSLEDCANAHLGPALADCAATCHSVCTGMTLASPCAHFCACMPVCANGRYAQAHPEAPALTGPECITACEKNAPYLADCLRSHCEFADSSTDNSDDELMHCEHATGVAKVCQNAAAPTGRLCLAAYESGWACDVGTQCCSKRCNSHVCD